MTSASRPGLGGAARAVADRARSLVQLEVQLALSEVKRKVATLGVGIGLLAGAALLAFFALVALIGAFAAALATVLDAWLALLVVAWALLVVAAVLVLVGRAQVRKSTPPVPQQAIEEARLTAEALRSGID